MFRRGLVRDAELLSSRTVQVHLEQLRILSQRSGGVRRSHERANGEGAPRERVEERAVVGLVRLVAAHTQCFRGGHTAGRTGFTVQDRS